MTIGGTSWIECECCGRVESWGRGHSIADTMYLAETKGWLLQCTNNGHFCPECKAILIMTNPGIHPKDIGRDENWVKSRLGQEKKVARRLQEERNIRHEQTRNGGRKDCQA